MRHVLKHTVIALLVFGALLTGYGVLVEPRLILDERRYVAPLPNLPDGWEGTEVAVVSDLQFGMWLANRGMVDRVMERVVEEEPDALLMAGDFLYSRDPSVPEQVDTLVQTLGPVLDEGIAVYAVLGNHDYAVQAAEEITTALEDQGVQVLRNEAVPMAHPGGADPAEDLYVVGLGPAVPGRADPQAALEGVPDDAARVVMMHNPTSFPQMPPGSAPLAVAGHTHCGQVALPLAPHWSYLGLTDEEGLVADGFAPREYGADGNLLFVTCGVGFSLAPVRINAPPQLVFFELVGQDGAR